jgi:hypothetical protein
MKIWCTALSNCTSAKSANVSHAHVVTVISNSSNSQPKYICPSNRIPGRFLVIYKNDMWGQVVTLSISLDAVLLPKRDKADANLKDTEEDRRACFDRHCEDSEMIFQIKLIRHCSCYNRSTEQNLRRARYKNWTGRTRTSKQCMQVGESGGRMDSVEVLRHGCLSRES